MADLNSSGQRIARGVARHLARLNFASLEEFVPTRGLRVDLMAIGPKSEIWIVECKSGRADFLADKKWQGYLDYCDSFFWAVDVQFPTNILPDEGGLIVADAFDAEILRIPEESTLSPARRKKIIHKFGRDAALRLRSFRDPDFPYGY
jgi:hypothetical protein